METKKILVMALLLTLFAGLANAAVTIPSVTVPAANEIFYPNMGDRIVVLDFNVIDTNTLNSIHTVTIDFNITGDTNKSIAADANLSSDNCTFTTSNVWTTPGANCHIRYTFPSGSLEVPTGTFVMDFNAVGYTHYDGAVEGGGYEGDANALVVFSVDNRFVNSSVEALLNIIPIVLIAAVLVGIVLMGFGVISGKTVLILAIGAVVSIIAVIVLSGILDVLTP